jgi:hypothetical protein
VQRRRGGAAQQVLGDVDCEVARSEFVQGGLGALEAGAQQGPSAREAQLERELEQVTSALGEAHVELRLLRRGGADFASRSWR